VLPAAQEHILALRAVSPVCCARFTDLSSAFALAVPHEQAYAYANESDFSGRCRAYGKEYTGRSQTD